MCKALKSYHYIRTISETRKKMNFLLLKVVFSVSLQWRPISNTSLEICWKPSAQLDQPGLIQIRDGPRVRPLTMARRGGVGLMGHEGF